MKFFRVIEGSAMVERSKNPIVFNISQPQADVSYVTTTAAEPASAQTTYARDLRNVVEGLSEISLTSAGSAHRGSQDHWQVKCLPPQGS